MSSLLVISFFKCRIVSTAGHSRYLLLTGRLTCLSHRTQRQVIHTWVTPVRKCDCDQSYSLQMTKSNKEGKVVACLVITEKEWSKHSYNALHSSGVTTVQIPPQAIVCFMAPSPVLSHGDRTNPSYARDLSNSTIMTMLTVRWPHELICKKYI